MEIILWQFSNFFISSSFSRFTFHSNIWAQVHFRIFWLVVSPDHHLSILWWSVVDWWTSLLILIVLGRLCHFSCRSITFVADHMLQENNCSWLLFTRFPFWYFLHGDEFRRIYPVWRFFFPISLCLNTSNSIITLNGASLYWMSSLLFASCSPTKRDWFSVDQNYKSKVDKNFFWVSSFKLLILARPLVWF